MAGIKELHGVLKEVYNSCLKNEFSGLEWNNVCKSLVNFSNFQLVVPVNKLHWPKVRIIDIQNIKEHNVKKALVTLKYDGELTDSGHARTSIRTSLKIEGGISSWST